MNLPTLDDVKNYLLGRKYRSTLDLQAAYQALPIAEDSQHLLGFEYRGDIWCFTKSPFGINFLVARFQATLRACLGHTDSISYLDDILSAHDDLGTHMDNLVQIVDALTENGFRINLTKSQFLKQTIVYWGYQWGHNAVKPPDERIRQLV